MSGLSAVTNHPSSAVLLDHVTGSLGFAHRCVVATHLRQCSTCQDTVLFLERVGSQLLSAVNSVEPPLGLLDKCLTSVAQEKSSKGKRKKPKTSW